VLGIAEGDPINGEALPEPLQKVIAGQHPPLIGQAKPHLGIAATIVHRDRTALSSVGR
jgi:hypothetical protein